MILLPTIPVTEAGNPLKTAVSAVPDGVFAAMLMGETEAPEAAGGKILPEGGKDLPDQLPPEGLALQFVRKMLGDSPAKSPGPKAGQQAPAQETKAEGESEEVIAPVADAELETSSATPVAIELDLIATATVIPVPLNTDGAPLPPAPAPASGQQEPEGTVSEQVPAKAPALKGTVFPMAFPGNAPVVEAQPQPVEAKPDTRTAVYATPALLAALAKQSDSAAEAAPVRIAQQAVPVEQAITSAAAAIPQGTVVRAARNTRPQLRGELALDAVKDAKAPAAGEQIARRTTLAASLALNTTFQPVAVDGAVMPVSDAKPTFAASPAQAVRPHEFSALVDRLVEAREAARPANANLTVNHADFGQVSVRFAQDNGNLSVALTSNDPGFIPAVNAAVAADASGNGDANFQGNRREDGGQPAARTAADSNGGERGAGRGSSERAARENDIQPQLRTAREEQAARGGIFA